MTDERIKEIRKELEWRLLELDKQLKERATLLTMLGDPVLGKELERIRNSEIQPIMQLVGQL